MARFETEREGQVAFYETFLMRIDPALSLADIIGDNNDGVLNGNLLEFKLQVSDLNANLFQCIKYLSARRIKGKPVPARIAIIDLTADVAYLYDSEDYRAEIETVYIGPASKNVRGFAGKPYREALRYSEMQGGNALVDRLREDNYMKINIDENCIVGWATRYYSENPMARKEDFIGDNTGRHKKSGEIRRPAHFKRYIKPYTGESNVRFQYLMDKLNDSIQKVNLGAFYTPRPYAEKSYELLRMAIRRVPDGNDYVIIDRCAGTGNLELGLTDEELSHCILSTVEYYEYKVLLELLGNKVRAMIPPVEAEDTFNMGMVAGADAFTREYVENPVIKEYVDNPRCTIILFENPPYTESTSGEQQRKGTSKSSGTWTKDWVPQQMRNDLKARKDFSGKPLRDKGNVFIWSAFEYYLRQPTDSYIVYSPVKYWKAQHLINKRFIKGFAFNRKWFHAGTAACIMVALWSNEEQCKRVLHLKGYDLDKDGRTLIGPVDLDVRRIQSLPSQRYYDKRPIPEEWRGGILCGLNGREYTGSGKISEIPARSPNLLGYLVSHSSGFDNPDFASSLLIAGRYDGHGFWLHRDNYLEKLPLFCMTRYYAYNAEWTTRGLVMKSGDGAKRFYSDLKSGKLDQWLLKCLLFTCVEKQNHMLTFTGSDGYFYRNELCLDVSNGETVATADLIRLERGEAERCILEQWDTLLAAARTTSEYNASLTYGVHQIGSEIDTFHWDEEGTKIWNNLEVHSALTSLKDLTRSYYNKEIVPNLFEYEFLK